MISSSPTASTWHDIRRKLYKLFFQFQFQFILGPLLFVLYMNDLPMATKSTESMLFANDTSIFYSRTDLDTATNIVNNELADVHLYMKANKLSVNIDKTNFVIFSSKQKSLSQPIPPILYNGVPPKQKKAVKFLGVYVDQHLTWKDHISYISKKIAKSVGIMCRSRFFSISHYDDEDRFILQLSISIPDLLFNSHGLYLCH